MYRVPHQLLPFDQRSSSLLPARRNKTMTPNPQEAASACCFAPPLLPPLHRIPLYAYSLYAYHHGPTMSVPFFITPFLLGRPNDLQLHPRHSVWFACGVSRAVHVFAPVPNGPVRGPAARRARCSDSWAVGPRPKWTPRHSRPEPSRSWRVWRAELGAVAVVGVELVEVGSSRVATVENWVA